MSRIQQIDAEIAALEAERKEAFFKRNEARGAARKQGFALGLTADQVSAYYKQDPDYIAAKTEYAIIQGNILDLQQEKEAIYRNDGFPKGYFGGATTQYTTYDENGDAASVVTRTSPTSSIKPVSQTTADPADPEADVPETTATPQTAAIPYISDEVYTATDDTVGWEAPPSDEQSKIGYIPDEVYTATDDTVGWEAPPTPEELEDIEFRMADAEFANLQQDVDWTEDFYLDNAEELDAIAAKYGVDPTSPQAKELWEQEYGFDDDLNLNASTNTGAGTNSGTTAPVARPPRSIHDGRHPIVDTDWRFRISLSPYADYLYNGPNPGILRPLKETDGVIFPYTPTIVRSSETNYQQYELTHSNFRGYFYTNSKEGNIMVTADFTAQDTNEAQYMLAMLHFFRSAGKMWYGQDARRGTPPPLLYLRGLGEHQFNEHACLLSTFTYTLPDNVDYIKTSNTATAQYAPKGRMAAGSGHESWSSKITRMVTSGIEDFLTTGELPDIGNLFGFGSSSSGNSLVKVTDGATYVPTKLQIQLALLPVNTRQQVSQEYSLEDFASGKLLKKGYW